MNEDITSFDVNENRKPLDALQEARRITKCCLGSDPPGQE